MSANAALLATRYARRPLLLEPAAAQDLAERISAIDARAFSRPGRLQALLRRVGLAGQGPAADASGARIMAYDDDYSPPPPIEQRLAYAPIWAGEPEDVGFCWSLNRGVAMMQVDTPLVERGEEFCGVVYHGYDTLKQGLADAYEDSRVGGIFVRWSCPGGPVSAGLPALTQFMREIRATGNANGKPIYMYADMACSAACWAMSAGDRIFAGRVGLVGSVGAVYVHTSYAGALDKAGIVVDPIHFGAEKVAGAWWADLSASAREDLQAEIDQCGRDFVADVVLSRPQQTAEGLIATQARVFMAHHDDPSRSGLALGFVDEISSEEEAFEALVARISSSNPAPDVANPAPATGRSASKPPKEKPMATKAPKVAAQVAQTAKAVALKAERTKLAARMAEIDAEAVEDPVEGADDAPADASEGVGDDDEADDDAEDSPEPEAAAEPEPEDETQAIAASAEAKTRPDMALTAIQTRMTLKQFKAAVATAGAPGKASPLAAAMAGSRRLGPDGGKPAGGGSTLAANARRKAGAQSGDAA